MARGWESKSVESQIEDAKSSRDHKPTEPEDDDVERNAKRQNLELSRRRIGHELESASSPVHRAALENALKYLDEQLRGFDAPAKS